MTFDASIGHVTGQRSRLAVNLAGALGHRILPDSSILVGPFHFKRPRLFQAGLRYRFCI